jgi:hypothetical protein
MNSSINNKKNAARIEKKQRRIDAGFVAALFPNVESIVINMQYRQRGIREPMPRIVNYMPGSHAYFVVECLNRECLEGGFDFTRIISSMIKDRKKTSKGGFGCKSDLSDDHSAIDYEVAINYQ